METNDLAKFDAALFLNELERAVKQIHDLYNAVKNDSIPLDHKLGEVDSFFWRRVEIVLRTCPTFRPEDWAALSTWLRCSTVAINHCLREVEMKTVLPRFHN